MKRRPAGPSEGVDSALHLAGNMAILADPGEAPGNDDHNDSPPERLRPAEISVNDARPIAEVWCKLNFPTMILRERQGCSNVIIGLLYGGAVCTQNDVLVNRAVKTN
jgi:hypothetical protein